MITIGYEVTLWQQTLRVIALILELFIVIDYIILLIKILKL